jgi:hypothetical protein
LEFTKLYFFVWYCFKLNRRPGFFVSLVGIVIDDLLERKPTKSNEWSMKFDGWMSMIWSKMGFQMKWKLIDECCENRWDELSRIKLTHKNEMKSNGWMWIYLM